jgi:hypothetical protein
MGTIALAGGTAVLSTSTLTVGSHSITVSYSGDANYSGVTSPAISQVVNQASSTVALGSNVNPAAFGQTVTLTATVAPQFGGSATGSVTFSDGATSLSSVPVASNTASLVVSNLSVGSHSLKAAYSGDTNVAENTSTVLTETIKKATSSVALSSSSNPALIGQSVTYTATVSPQFGGTPSGTVTFKQGAVVLGTVPLSGGVAAFTTSYANAGTFTIKAAYSGDGNFVSSLSAALKEVVTGSSVSVAVTSDVNPSAFGQPVTITATLSTSGPTLDGQTVTFQTGPTFLGSATISGGVATLSTSSLNAGVRKITANYNGDAAHSPASGSLSQTVTKAATTTTLTSDVNPSGVGQNVTFTATVSSVSALPTGTVKFKSGGAVLGTATLSGGVATLATNSLSAGSHKVTATYAPTPNFAASSASLTQKVE